MVHLDIDADGIASIIVSGTGDVALSHGLRKALSETFLNADANPAVKCILLFCEASTFFRSPDYREYLEPPQSPTMGQLCQQVEACRVPVIAVVQGDADSAAFELALAAHYRIASAKALFGFADVALGIVPGAGATQRLPRLCGPAPAMELMMSGRRVSAAEAARLNLVDRVEEGDLVVAAMDVASDILGGAKPPLRSRDRHDGFADPSGYLNIVQAFRARVAQQDRPAPRAIVECVEAAQLLPFDAGLARESTAHRESLAQSQTRALCHLVISETKTALMPAGSRRSDIKRVAVVAGENAPSWVVGCLNAGAAVVIAADDEALLKQTEGRVRRILARAQDAQRMSAETVARRLAGLRHMSEAEALSSADLVFLTEPDKAAQVEAKTGPGTILALVQASGQAIPFDALEKPGKALGLTVVGPDAGGRLVEILMSADTDRDIAQVVSAFVHRTGRIAVQAPTGNAGGIGSAVWGAGMLAAQDLARQGADPAAIDAALKAASFSSLPFGGTQTAGGGAARIYDNDEVVERVVLAMANTGALLLDAGEARQPADIDLAMVVGYGFPRQKGGPMFAADEYGLLKLRKRLMALMAENADFWQPAPLIEDLIKNGRTFGDLND